MFTKKQIQKYKETRDWFKDRMKGSVISENSGLRFNGELVEPHLMKIVDGKKERYVTVLGSAKVNLDSDSVFVQTSIKTEQKSGNRFIDLDVDADVETVRVIKPKKFKKSKK